MKLLMSEIFWPERQIRKNAQNIVEPQKVISNTSCNSNAITQIKYNDS